MSASLRLAVLIVLGVLMGLASPLRGEQSTEATTRPRPGRAILVVMDEVLDRLLPKFVDSPRDESRRVSVKGGLVGLGSYTPPGGEGYGVKGPPIHVFPRAGAGQSLNVDPITGRSYFGWP